MEKKSIMHYSSSHKILLVGEGDFSFTLCLAKAFGSAVNIIATSLDDRGMNMRAFGTFLLLFDRQILLIYVKKFKIKFFLY
jgi:25S rRNA (uracil2634-N3)-methyltransferase